MTQIETRKELDEGVWQAWLMKNKAQETLRFARLLRASFLVAALLIVGALLWSFKG
jgi:hypothetical protein